MLLYGTFHWNAYCWCLLFFLASSHAVYPNAEAYLAEFFAPHENILLEESLATDGDTDAIADETFAELARRTWEKGAAAEFSEWDLHFRLGGRLFFDAFFPYPDAGLERVFGEQSSRADFRAAWLILSGEWSEHFHYLVEYDFVRHGAFKNVLVGLKNLPAIGNLWIGRFKEPFSLEELTSGRYITFMERGLPKAFAPSRNLGVMIHDSLMGQRMTYAVGAFKKGGGKGLDLDEGDWITTLRLTGLPWYEDNGRRLIHLGAAYRYEDPSHRSIRYSTNSESAFAPRFVNTGPISARHVQHIGLETAFVYGPYSLQGEWITSIVSSPDGEFSFEGYYLFASVFLTGEHRPYNRSTGALNRVKPLRSLWESPGGPGAWEVALRYSGIDLNDRFVQGGRLNDFTVGVNWHLTPYHRMMWNYIHADLAGVGSEDIIQLRWQMDF